MVIAINIMLMLAVSVVINIVKQISTILKLIKLLYIKSSSNNEFWVSLFSLKEAKYTRISNEGVTK